ncbi:MAG: glycosyltransferase family 2 protein [Chloroflexota bacterium]
MSKPLFSIITPSLNRAEYITDAIESVLGQNYPDFEHLILDGGSDDGTLDILVHYPHLQIVSEKDTGMYAALNKGLELAKGEWIGFLNSDDLYAGNIFTNIAEKFRDEHVFAVAGEAIIFNDTAGGKREIRQHFSPAGKSLLELATLGSPFFNAWFFRRSVFDKIGKLNSNYRIAADREFMLRFALSNLEYTAVDIMIYQYRQHAGAMTFEVNYQKLERIVKEHLQMTDSYLRQPDLPRQAMRLIRQASTQDTLEAAAHAISKGKLGTAAYFMAAGTRHDLAWVIKFGKRALGKLRKLSSKKQEKDK